MTSTLETPLTQPFSQQEQGTTNHAPIKWAQRSDRLFLTIDLHDVTDEVIALTDTTFKFRGSCEGKVYIAELEFYKNINADESSYKVLPRSVQVVIMKRKEEGKEKEKFWPHLLKDKMQEKNKYELTIDWAHYVDEDEEDENESTGFDWSKWK